MIAARELRIGNKVVGNNTWAEITGIVSTAAGCIVYINEGQNAYLPHDVQPVPLSRATVEKCWFTLSEDGFWYEHIATTLYPIYLMQLNGAWQFSLTDPCGIAHWKPISWLHQLQNLYFALTDDELEIVV